MRADELARLQPLAFPGVMKRIVLEAVFKTQTEFVWEPLGKEAYQMVFVPERVAPEIARLIQTSVESGLTDEDDPDLFLFRYQGVAIFHTLHEGCISGYHYRCDMPDVDGQWEFDIRDLPTWDGQEDEPAEMAAIQAAIEQGLFVKGADFLDVYDPPWYEEE